MSDFYRTGNAKPLEWDAGRAFVKSPHDGSWKEIGISAVEISWPEHTKLAVPDSVTKMWDLNDFSVTGSMTFKIDESNADFFQKMYDWATQQKIVEEFDTMQEIRRLAYERMPLLSLYPEMN